MALLERVSALIRANLNDLIDRAEDPQKMLKQVILDMQNQMLQVKTQVAIAIADEHLLRKKAERKRRQARRMDAQGRTGHRQETGRPRARRLERAVGYRDLAANFAEEIEHQKTQVEHLRSAMKKLEQKLVEAQAKSELLIAKHRRSRALTKASRGQDCRGGRKQDGHLRPHEEQNPRRRGYGPGDVGNGE